MKTYEVASSILQISVTLMIKSHVVIFETHVLPYFNLDKFQVVSCLVGTNSFFLWQKEHQTIWYLLGVICE